MTELQRVEAVFKRMEQSLDLLTLLLARRL